MKANEGKSNQSPIVSLGNGLQIIATPSAQSRERRDDLNAEHAEELTTEVTGNTGRSKGAAGPVFERRWPVAPTAARFGGRRVARVARRLDRPASPA
jgi:hypothetical protein